MDFNWYQNHILGSIGLLHICFQILRQALPWLYTNLIGPKLCGPLINVRHMGDWAVVTGATDGIGKSYAKALAKRGLNLVLISRSIEKLENVGKEIGDSNHVQIKTINVDFMGGSEIYDKIQKHIDGLNIGVLVNNVGMSYPHPEYFDECYKENPNFLRNIIAVNIHSVTHMCALILSGMLSKKKGLIINVSSTSAVIPNPLLTVYSATKAFVDKFSVDLQTEYRCQGIIVQSIQPGFVATNMTKIRKISIFVPSADTYVNSALQTIGITGETAGYFPHCLLQLFITIADNILGARITANFVLNNLLQTRNRALRNSTKKKN